MTIIRPDYGIFDSTGHALNPRDPHHHYWDIYGDWSFVISKGYHHRDHRGVPDGYRNWGDTIYHVSMRPRFLHLVRLGLVRDGHEYWVRIITNETLLDLIGGVEDVEPIPYDRWNRCIWMSDETIKRMIAMLPTIEKLAQD